MVQESVGRMKKDKDGTVLDETPAKFESMCDIFFDREVT